MTSGIGFPQKAQPENLYEFQTPEREYSPDRQFSQVERLVPSKEIEPHQLKRRIT